MSKIQDLINKIEQEKIGGAQRRVLIVEGVDDVHALESFLTKWSPNWSQDWVVADAGKKAHVLDVLTKRPEWCGVVDPDEWTEVVIEQQVQEHPSLWMLPRYCLENYLCDPQELWRAFPPKQQQKIEGGIDDLTNKVTTDLDKWVCHGVLWSVINPLWEGLRSRGFKEALLNPDIAQDNQQIQETLTSWHHYLEPDDLFRSYQEKLADVQQLSTEQKLKRWVHGKQFYKAVVNVVLNDLLGVKAADVRKKAIFRTSPVPEDLKPLWEKMGLVPEGVN